MNPSRQRLLVVILVLLLILAWLILDRAGATNPLRDSFSQVLTPIQLVLHRAGRPLFRVADEIGRLSRLNQENQVLREENAALRNQVVLLEEARIENETLRRQLNFKSAVPGFQLLAAEVVGHDSSDLMHYLIIDRGSQDGIRRGMPVLAAEGLVGRIREVSANSSKVMLITDPSSSVATLIQRTRGTGVVQGKLRDQLVMDYITPDEPVLPGDVVLTSGLGGNFPKRLVVGHVVSVERADVAMFQQALVEPAVKLRDLETVLVLLSYGGSDLPEPESIP